MDKWFHPTLNRVCDYISMMWLKLNHAQKVPRVCWCWYSDPGGLGVLLPKLSHHILIICMYICMHNTTDTLSLYRFVTSLPFWFNTNCTEVSWSFGSMYFTGSFCERLTASIVPGTITSPNYSQDYPGWVAKHVNRRPIILVSNQRNVNLPVLVYV